MSLTLFINSIFTICSFVIYLLLLIACLFDGNLKQPVFRWFFILTLTGTFYGLSDIVIGLNLISFEMGGKASLFAASVIEAIALAGWGFSAYAVVRYVYEYISTKKKIPSLPLRFAAAFAAANAIIIAVMSFIPRFSILNVDVGGEYLKGEIYAVAFLVSLPVLFIYFYLVLSNIKALNTRERISMMFYVIFLFVAYFVNIFLPQLLPVMFASAIIVFVMYVNLQQDIKNKQQAMLEENRINMLVSQMKPHYLYNSLTAISELCASDEKAYNAVISFANYMRANMDSITDNRLITFETELEHVENYLQLEKLRMNGELKIDYDLETIEFMLPSLSLQPLVENALRHGRAGKIKISTKMQQDGVSINVSDNGKGFEVSTAEKNDERSHTGIANVNERLAALCGGNLKIKSSPGQGCSATITIPFSDML